MDLRYELWARDVQEIVVVFHLFWTLFEHLDVATIIIFLQFVDLDLGTHTTIEYDNALLELFLEVGPQLVNIKIVLTDRLWFRIHGSF